MESTTDMKPQMMTDRQMITFNNYNEEQVVVTHIETPEKFFCRLSSDENRFNEMNDLIWSRVRSPFAEQLVPDSVEVDGQLLAYSTIHQIWCRSRVDEVLTVGLKMSAKVYLLDFGSGEVVTYANLRSATDEIMDFNSGQSFCFECRLSLIKPFSETQEWSSYANYTFKKQTKDKIIRLKFAEYEDGVVVCDLAVQWPNDCNTGVYSMTDFLVQSRVANYRMGHDFYNRIDCDHSLTPDEDVLEYPSDDEVVAIDPNDDNKLYY